MSYQVLARKYRPRRFQELVGQDVVARALTHALEQNRLHHAYLFTGTRGVGKTTIARILARCLNCETGITASPCGVCGSCREIDEGRFVDLIEVDAASRTKVEDTRELLENVQYAPTRGRYKVYLIDEVHMLSGHSFNALLKTLEEPPPHVKFILATTDPQKLPITILSRCLQFALKPMSPERIVGHLQQLLPAEQVAFEEPALWLLARAAQGSMRDALSLTDQAIAFGHGRLAEREVRQLLGSVDRDLVFRVMDALVAGDARGLLAVVAGMAEQSIDFAAALGELITLLHRLALAQAVPEAIDNAEGDRDRLLALAGSITAEDLQLYYQMALQGRRDLPLAMDARAGFEMTLLRMMVFRPATAVDLPPATPSPAPVSVSVQTAAQAAPAPVVPVLAEPVPATPAPVAVTDWTGEQWAEWVEQSGLTGAALNLARHGVLSGQDLHWQLRLSPRHQMLAGGQAWAQLQARLIQAFPNARLSLNLEEPVEETPAARRQRLREARLQQAEAAVLADPVVRGVMDTFAATVVPDSLQLPH